NAVNRVWKTFDWTWVHNRVGLRLKNYFEQNHVFVVDSSDRFAYALAGRSSVGPKWFGAMTAELTPVIDAVRGRPSPLKPEDIDAARKPARASHVQMFMGRPAIVAAMAVGSGTGQARLPDQPPPLVITVTYLRDRFLTSVSRRLELPHLRLTGLATPVGQDN